MLTKRQQQVLKAMVNCGIGRAYSDGLWYADVANATDVYAAMNCDTFGASTIYALAHQGLVAFIDSYTVAPTPKGEALAALLDETTMVTRRGSGVVIS
jgi:F0F1-type ATP synthase membrane subunit a